MAKRAKKKDSARKLAIGAARVAEENNSQDIVVLDLRGISPVTDYFVIATGTSDRQMLTVVDEIARFAKGIGEHPYHIAGRDSAQWIVLDYVDVVIHLFDNVRRHYYDLELIWGEAPRVPWRRRSRKKPEPPQPD